ncbi:MAG: NIL domain-containing protein [Desulfobacca sp.]|uniref:NIL domain-containing protein n=1 Tax=Desulfobacca sp. TaxID=2067990 RepID=UPI004049E2E7
MMTKKVVLHFPPQIIDQPITYRLIRDFGLVVNILRAQIASHEWGRMVVELAEDGGRWQEALDYLRELGVRVKPLASEARWLEERCSHCTACTGLCPSRALYVADPQLRTIAYDQERCIACGLCVKACPYRAMEIQVA